MSPAGAEQGKRQWKYQQHALSKKLAIDRGEVVQLFVELDELDETLLKKAISLIRQRLESAEERAVEVEL